MGQATGRLGIKLAPFLWTVCGFADYGLEHLAEPPDLVEADEDATEDVEGQEDVGALIITHAQAPEAVQPRMGAFDHPAVTSKALAVVEASPGDTGLDATNTAFLAAAPVVVALVGMQLGGPA